MVWKIAESEHCTREDTKFANVCNIILRVSLQQAREAAVWSKNAQLLHFETCQPACRETLCLKRLWCLPAQVWCSCAHLMHSILDNSVRKRVINLKVLRQTRTSILLAKEDPFKMKKFRVFTCSIPLRVQQ